MKQTFLTDREFGRITLREHPRARHLIFRVRQGQLFITHPPRTKPSNVLESIEEKRADLRRLFQRAESRFLQPGDIVYTRLFILLLTEGEGSRIESYMENGTLHIALPRRENYNDPTLQRTIARHIQPHLKAAAESYLPQRVEYWAKETGSRYNGLKITYGHRRLGACHSDRHISLSYRLMYLPERLIDYIILHELSHLKEMNHGRHFHEICNSYCKGKEQLWRKELKNFPFPTPY
ncbi:MAG: M48 family metallopeptidase [Porphyromonadaceae bacterium]|nr:M48 family metallopeptidase [Porphyromonadaceae bacterium]